MIKTSILSQNEIGGIRTATLQLLEDTGVVLTHEDARKRLREAGAHTKGDRVFLPPTLVEEALGNCPSQVKVRGRSGETVCLGDGEPHWHNVGGARDVFDPRSGQCRKATIQDVEDAARLLDALEEVTTVSPFFTPQDVPGEVMSLAMYRYSLPFTTKPLQGPGVQTGREVKYAVRMAEVLGAPQEVLTLSVSPVSPLIFPDDVCEAIIDIARLGIPFAPLPCPTAGVTAPFSLAGALTQQNAEVLTAVALAQIVQPGLPIVYCGRLAMMEPRTASSVWSGVELGLVSAATVEIGHSYNLPVNVYGFTTNANTIDIQSGFERAMNAAIPLLAGADELSGVGELGAGVMGSFAQMVCDDEFIASLRRLQEGVSVDEERLALGLIDDVAQGNQNFMASPHTVKHLRGGELFPTTLAERRPWKVWVEEGQENMAQRAQSKAERILNEYEVPPLTSTQVQTLDELLNSFQKEVGVG